MCWQHLWQPVAICSEICRKWVRDFAVFLALERAHSAPVARAAPLTRFAVPARGPAHASDRPWADQQPRAGGIPRATLSGGSAYTSGQHFADSMTAHLLAYHARLRRCYPARRSPPISINTPPPLAYPAAIRRSAALPANTDRGLADHLGANKSWLPLLAGPRSHRRACRHSRDRKPPWPLARWALNRAVSDLARTPSRRICCGCTANIPTARPPPASPSAACGRLLGVSQNGTHRRQHGTHWRLRRAVLTLAHIAMSLLQAPIPGRDRASPAAKAAPTCNGAVLASTGRSSEAGRGWHCGEMAKPGSSKPATTGSSPRAITA